jgi:hypothetical protein
MIFESANIQSRPTPSLFERVFFAPVINPEMNELTAFLTATGSPIQLQVAGVNLSMATGTVALTSGQVRYLPVYNPNPRIVNGVIVGLRTAGVFTVANFNGAGLYSLDSSNGVLTEIAETANDASFLTSGFVNKQLPFTSPVNIGVGDFYIAILYNSSAQTTAPALSGSASINTQLIPLALSPNNIKIYGARSAQNTLALSVNSSDIIALPSNTGIVWAALY